MNLLGTATRSIPINGRTLNTDIGEIDLTRSIKVTDVKDTITRYSLILVNHKTLTFENIIIKENNEGITSYILKYDANAEWLIKNSGNFKMANFTGFVSLLNIERELISKAEVKNGIGITIERGKTIKNGGVNCDGGGSGSGGGGGGGGDGSGDGGGTGGGGSGSGGSSGGLGGSSGGGSGGSTGCEGGGQIGDPCTWTFDGSTLDIDCGDWGVIAKSCLLIIKVQVSVIYLNAAAKLAIKEWIDGTAIHYWFKHPLFGYPDWLTPLIEPLILNGTTLFMISWGTIIFEFLLFAGILMDNRYKKFFLISGILFHFGIFLVHDLASFLFTMVSCLILFLRPANEPFHFLIIINFKNKVYGIINHIRGSLVSSRNTI